MLTEKLQALDRTLRERHEALYATLQPGVAARQTKFQALGDWFSWKDGQNGSSAPFGGALLFGWHRFVPFDEGQSQFRSMRRAAWTNPIRAVFFLTISRQLLRSWPLLIDASGAGYYFDTGRQTVLYRLEGEQDLAFDSFEKFVDFLIELSGLSADQQTFLEAEQRLLQRYESDAA